MTDGSYTEASGITHKQLLDNSFLLPLHIPQGDTRKMCETTNIANIDKQRKSYREMPKSREINRYIRWSESTRKGKNEQDRYCNLENNSICFTDKGAHLQWMSC